MSCKVENVCVDKRFYFTISVYFGEIRREHYKNTLIILSESNWITYYYFLLKCINLNKTKLISNL